jgi:hypothetical protein
MFEHCSDLSPDLETWSIEADEIAGFGNSTVSVSLCRY